MKKDKPIFTILLSLFIISLAASDGMAVDVAPRITDREIVERLFGLEEGQKSLDRRFDDLRSEMNSRFDERDKRFDLLTWTIGLFITIALVILAFVIRMLWQMQKRGSRGWRPLQTS